MLKTIKALAELSNDLDEMGEEELSQEIDGITEIVSEGNDFMPGQNMTNGENMFAIATGLTSMPIENLPYEEGMKTDPELETKFFDGKGGPEGLAELPPINEKYQMELSMDKELDSLEATLSSLGLKYAAGRVTELRKQALDEGDAANLGTGFGIMSGAFPGPWAIVPAPIRMALSGAAGGNIGRELYRYFSRDVSASEKLKSAMDRLEASRNKLLSYGVTEDQLKELSDGKLDSWALSKQIADLNKKRKISKARAFYNAIIKEANMFVSIAKEIQTLTLKFVQSAQSKTQSRMQESMGRGTKPEASGGVSSKKSSALAKLQELIGTTPDGIWGDKTEAAWIAFADKHSAQYNTKVKAEVVKGNWPAAAKALGYSADYSGMVKFAEAMLAGGAPKAEDKGEEKPASAQEKKPEEPAAPESEELAPVSANEIVPILSALEQDKVDHMVEGMGGSERAMKGRYSRRRTRRYLRHLDDKLPGEGSVLERVAAFMIDNHAEAINAALKKAKESHDKLAESGAKGLRKFDADHRRAHLVFIVYNLLQRVWGAETGKENAASRRERRIQRRIDKRR